MIDWIKQHRTLLSWVVSIYLAMWYVIFTKPFSPDYARTGELGAPRRTTVELPPRPGRSQAKSYYNSSANQTSVYLGEDIVLSDDQGRRLVLSPIYDVPGGQVTHPRTVLLRFSLFAPAADITPTDSVWIEANGKELRPSLSVSPTLGGDEAGRAVLNFWVTLRHEEFLDVIGGGGGSGVWVGVGSTKIKLSGAQVEALRDMQRCADAGECR